MLDFTARSEETESTGLTNPINSIKYETHTPKLESDQLPGPQPEHLDSIFSLNIRRFDNLHTGHVINYAFITNSKIRNTVMNNVVYINITMRDPRIINTMIASYVHTSRISAFTMLDNADIDDGIVFNSIIVNSVIDDSEISDSTLSNVKLMNPVFCSFQFPELPF
ncbi:hypothetical protein PENANT_c023G02437 [Penicillium antarcticum]|uniref:Uncharacterized protein n=1 Tax=Penicillium antarcticum TaxID=416450 RepID=A0A1V6PZK8_9EURO|nr:uncharacterized protein N7508_006201 [Penicillium antarcticum]KAJ5301338.1 hypothetical protein N7508_006201 [Penicillium antarcticum]OQD82082.1 hypothetical protein PENANT_c023G02437 [Penicillium antarcticum]